jgi:hypothetical protein
MLHRPKGLRSHLGRTSFRLGSTRAVERSRMTFLSRARLNLDRFSPGGCSVQSVNISSVDKSEGRLDVATQLGSSSLVMVVYDLEPGRSSSPYHYEYERGVALGGRGHARRART